MDMIDTFSICAPILGMDMDFPHDLSSSEVEKCLQELEASDFSELSPRSKGDDSGYGTDMDLQLNNFSHNEVDFAVFLQDGRVSSSTSQLNDENQNGRRHDRSLLSGLSQDLFNEECDEQGKALDSLLQLIGESQEGTDTSNDSMDDEWNKWIAENAALPVLPVEKEIVETSISATAGPIKRERDEVETPIIATAGPIKRQRVEVEVKQEVLEPSDSFTVAVKESIAKKLKISEEGLLMDAVKSQLICKKRESYNLKIQTFREKISRQNVKQLEEDERKKEGRILNSIKIQKLQEEIQKLESDPKYQELQKKLVELKSSIRSPWPSESQKESMRLLTCGIAHYQKKIDNITENIEELKLRNKKILTYSNKISEFEEKIRLLDDVNNKAHEKLFHDESIHRTELIDFPKIAEEVFQNRYSSIELALIWEKDVRPNKKPGPLDATEKQILKSLLPLDCPEDQVDWKKIAEKLKTMTKSKLPRGESDLIPYYYRLKNGEFGWTDEEDKELRDIIEPHLKRMEHNPRHVIPWSEIAKLPVYLGRRTKTQLYSHWRYINHAQSTRFRPYTKAEDELIRIGVGMDLSCLQISQLLDNRRNPHQVQTRYKKLFKSQAEKAETFVNKLQGTSMYDDNEDEETPVDFQKFDRQQLIFGKRIERVFEKYDFYSLLKEGNMENIEIPKELGAEIVEILDADPDLVTGKIVKPKGKPGRKKKIVGLEEQLRDLLRPLSIIKNRRRRVTSYPGDGREHGLVLSALYRLLGVKFDRSKTPSVNSTFDELLEAGVHEPDHSSYKTMLEILDSLPEGQIDSDSKNYSAGELPPDDSLLPPTLHTLNGYRGVCVYQDSLRTQAAEGELKPEQLLLNEEDIGEFSEQLLSVQPFGDDEADKRLYFFMESLFHWPAKLEQVYQHQPMPEK